MHSKKHVNSYLSIKFQKIVRTLFEILISCLNSGTTQLLFFSLFIIVKIWIFRTVYKVWRFYLYGFWRPKALNILHRVTFIHRHIHGHRPIFKTLFFWLKVTSKHKNHVKIRYWKFWPKTIYLLPNDSQGMEITYIFICILFTYF